MVLVHRDVLRAQADEVAGAVGAVVIDQHAADHVAHVQDGPIDVEDDHQRVVRMALPHGRVLLGEGSHPIVHSSSPWAIRIEPNR